MSLCCLSLSSAPCSCVSLFLSRVRSAGVCFLLLCLILLPGRALGELKTEIFNKKTKIALEATDKEIRLTIQSPAAFSCEVFSLENPARIVIDAMGVKLKSHKNKSSGKSKMLKGLRTGFYSDHVRLVLDLHGSAVPDYTTDQKGATFFLKAGGTDRISALKSQEKEEEKESDRTLATPTPLPSPVVSPSAPPVDTREPAAVETPEAVPAEASPEPSPAEPSPSPTALSPAAPSSAEADAAAASRRNQVGSLLFDIQEDSSSLLKVVLTDEAAFKLSREQEYYLLTISDCEASGTPVLLPHYPPDGFKGISAVKGMQAGEDYQLLIYVDRTTKLNASRNGNQIWIKTAERSPL